MCDEFAKMCVAYIKIIKQQTGIDIYALSIQNEPGFASFIHNVFMMAMPWTICWV